MKQTLYLIRGIPGSGKTTLAKQLLEQGKAQRHFEADTFFTSPEGVYVYDKNKIKTAHFLCQRDTRQALLKGYSVVVANTFTMVHELTPYYDIADHAGVYLKIIRATGNYDNVHDVPREIVDMMRDRFQPVPSEVLDTEFFKCEVE